MNDRYRLRGAIADEQRLARFYRLMNPVDLVRGGCIVPNWMRDGVSFWYAEGMPYDTVIHRVDGNTGAAAPLFDVSKTRRALAAQLGCEPPYRGLPFDSFVELDEGRYRFSFERAQYVLSVDGYVIEQVAADAAVSAHLQTTARLLGVHGMDRRTPRSYRRTIWLMEPMLVTEAPSPQGQWFASVKDGNIALRASIDDRTVMLTADGTSDVIWDIEAPRPNSSGMDLPPHTLDPWSPDGTRLFAIKLDRRAVPDLPFIRYLKPEEELCSVKLQRAGGPLDIAHPHVIDVKSKRQRRLELGETEDQYFTLVGWLPDGSEVLFTRHSRDFKSVDLLAGNPTDGSVRTVLSERAETFVALQHEVIFFGDNHVTLLPEGAGVIWRSSRSGWNHFYVHGIDGLSSRALTQGEFPVIDVVAIDHVQRWVYFTAHHDQERPYDTHLCRVPLAGGEIRRLTRLDGHNAASISPTKQTFTVVNSRPDRPFRTDFHRCDGTHLATVQHANTSALDALGYVTPQEFTVTAADGHTQLWGVMHKPADFDAGKKYPVIDYIYGGPQLAMVPHHFGLGGDAHTRLSRALAQLGYIVISVDARGTPERSKAFQDVVYRNWGRHEIPDHAAALQQLAQRHSFIDLDRVGIYGQSWGGYFTIRALVQAPQVFHVGVASAPGIDPNDLIIYEPYLDLPARAKAAYDYASLYSSAHRIAGKLMLVAGTCDPPRPGMIMKLVHRLIDAGIDHELVMLPEGHHGLLGDRNEDYFIQKLVKHFETHLKFRDQNLRDQNL